LLDQVATLFLDHRFDVAHAAVKTFFSILSSNAGRIPATVTSYYLTTGWPRLLRNGAFLACGPIFVVCLQELAHHICGYWDQFDAEPLRLEFLPFLITVSENFIFNCTVGETIVDSYQIYGYFLTLPRPPIETQLAWLESLKRLCYEKFKFEPDLNSPLLSHLGRFLCNVIRSFENRVERVAYAEWLNFVVDMALSFNGNEFVHITPQRAMDGFVGLFPLSEPYASITIQAFVEMFVQTNHLALQQNVCDDLVEVWKRPENRQAVLLLAKPLFLSEISERLCSVILSLPLEIGEEMRQEVIECYCEIARGHPALSAQADERVKGLSA
jgi:hypothetical protein